MGLLINYTLHVLFWIPVSLGDWFLTHTHQFPTATVLIVLISFCLTTFFKGNIYIWYIIISLSATHWFIHLISQIGIHATFWKKRRLILLTSLHFASCLSTLTLLVGESWRVGYALIWCFAILQKPVSDDRIRKMPIQPVCLPSQMVLQLLP